MNKMHKALIATTAVAVGIGMFNARQASELGQEVRTLQEQQSTLTEQIQQLQRELDDATNHAKRRQAENESRRSNQNISEVLELRAEVGRLRQEQSNQGRDPFTLLVLAETDRAARLNQQLAQMPDRKIPELAWLRLTDWFDGVQNADLESDAGVRKALSRLRHLAKSRLYPVWQNAFHAYLNDNNNQLPSELAQLKPYFAVPLDDAILARYQLAPTASATTRFTVGDFRLTTPAELTLRAQTPLVRAVFPGLTTPAEPTLRAPIGDYFLIERTPVDKDYDERYEMGLGCDRWTQF